MSTVATPATAPRLQVYNRSRFTPVAGDWDTLRTERIVSVMRGTVATLGLWTLSQDPLESALHVEIVRTLLYGYGALAAGLTVILFSVSSISPRLPLALHAVDIFVAAALTLFSQSANSPLLVFVLYPVCAAAFRWGLYEVLLTVLFLDGLLLTQGAVMASGLTPRLGLEVQPGTVVARAVSIPIIGGMIGYLAESEKQHRLAQVDLDTVLRTARVSGELDQTLALVLGSLGKTFGAPALLLALTDKRTGRVFIWRTDAIGGAAPVTGQVELSPSARRNYFFELPGAVTHVVRRRFWTRHGKYRLRAFAEDGRPVRQLGAFKIPVAFATEHRFERMVSVGLGFDNSWTGRLFIFDPRRHLSGKQAARLAGRIAIELGPATHGLYRIHGLRTRAQAVERSRIGRELHDGLTQSLLGAEMLIAVLRRRVLEEAPSLDIELRRIHDIVREEIVTLRELIDGTRAGETVSGDPVSDLDELVARFGRHTGIVAKLISSGGAVPLPVRVQREVAQIVHEALVNVRKHSLARRVLVRSVVSHQHWSISIEDDGQGFAFEGRKTQTQLDELHLGPHTIGERARLIGAELVVESKPGSGSRIEIDIPLNHAS